MKNYLVFFGNTYYPIGGMNDFEADFDDLNDAIGYLTDKFNEENSSAWGHIYSIMNKSIIYEI